MTLFQLVSFVFFLVVGGVSYRTEIAAFLKKLQPPTAPNTPTTPETPPAVTPQSLVNDMVTVASLRDRLGSIGCKDGVDACTLLLRVMVEYKYPQV